jgi:hypothetical protein
LQLLAQLIKTRLHFLHLPLRGFGAGLEFFNVRWLETWLFRFRAYAFSAIIVEIYPATIRHP